MFTPHDSKIFELKELQQKRVEVLENKIKELQEEIELLYQTMNRMDDL
jgi:prefoldin subunit 5